MKKVSWIVTKEDERPAGAGSGHCFYCPSLIGREHTKGCVLRVKTVVINLSVDLVIEMPEHWTKEDIEFSRNEGTWCADNIIQDLKENTKHNCLCDRAKFKFVREATNADLINTGKIDKKEDD